jgi:hypothetical protein
VQVGGCRREAAVPLGIQRSGIRKIRPPAQVEALGGSPAFVACPVSRWARELWSQPAWLVILAKSHGPCEPWQGFLCVDSDGGPPCHVLWKPG